MRVAPAKKRAVFMEDESKSGGDAADPSRKPRASGSPRARRKSEEARRRQEREQRATERAAAAEREAAARAAAAELAAAERAASTGAEAATEGGLAAVAGDAPAASGAANEVEPPADEERPPEHAEDLGEAQTAQQDVADRRTLRWLYLGGAVVLVLFLVAFWPIMQGRLTAAKQLDQAAALLDQARGSVNDVDKVVRVQLSAEQAETVPDVNPPTLVARRELKQALALLQDALPHLTEDEQRRGNLIKTSAEARLTMLDRAPTILRATVKAVRAKNLGDAAWQRSLNASGFEARANTAYAKQTALGARSSQDLYTRAAGSLLLAIPLYSQAASAFPEADFGIYTSYTKQRIYAVRTAASASIAWLSGDAQKARELRSAYSVRSAKAAQTLATLPIGPGRTTGDAFAQLAGRAVEAYEAARAQADNAEKALKSQ